MGIGQSRRIDQSGGIVNTSPSPRANPAVNRWRHKDAASKFTVLVQMFGKPTSRTNTPHGAAIWKDVSGTKLFGTPTCLKNVMLIDESIAHNCPEPHSDFLYMTLPLLLTPEERDSVTRISGSIWYDGLKRQLTVRCGSVAANIATAHTVLRVLNGEITIDDVHANSLYAAALDRAKQPDQVGEMHAHLCEMVAVRGPVEMTGYYSGAFNSECGPPSAVLPPVNIHNGNPVMQSSVADPTQAEPVNLTDMGIDAASLDQAVDSGAAGADIERLQSFSNSTPYDYKFY